MAMAICGKSMEVWEITLGMVCLEGFIGPIPAAIKNNGFASLGFKSLPRGGALVSWVSPEN